ncbi:hypothetical protein THOG11_70185 [Vibrio harveyi]|nr:hypothetical protein TH15OA1_460184 [Vibrio harveyi]CAH1577989.1 hypothetical protein THOD03_60185 [Vibrio harveyi]CAH1587044.1 hypothetical protein THOG11_70185 [Vibrio harveyi]
MAACIKMPPIQLVSLETDWRTIFIALSVTNILVQPMRMGIGELPNETGRILHIMSLCDRFVSG